MLHEQVFIYCPRLFTTRSHIALFGPSPSATKPHQMSSPTRLGIAAL